MNLRFKVLPKIANISPKLPDSNNIYNIIICLYIINVIEYFNISFLKWT